ncbi:MAG: hypothetical protein NT154_37935, partial [Verrucomicrobia bacterium]|nr:hypothetical protein [Verrucomicrobiota bacterium]
PPFQYTDQLHRIALEQLPERNGARRATGGFSPQEKRKIVVEELLFAAVRVQSGDSTLAHLLGLTSSRNSRCNSDMAPPGSCL